MAKTCYLQQLTKKLEEVPKFVGICHVLPWEEAKSPSVPSASRLMALRVFLLSGYVFTLRAQNNV